MSASRTVAGDPDVMDGFYVKVVEGMCLGSSLVFSGLCYYHYKKNQTALDKLDVGVDNAK